VLRLRHPAPVLALALTLAGGLTACGGEDATVSAPSTAPAPVVTGSTAAPEPTSVASGIPTPDVDQQIALTYAGGKVTGDTGRVPVRLGSKVRIVVTSDVAEELHLHVYDREVPVQPGVPAEIVFTADVPGQVALELHEAGTVLVRLVIS
jgi:hypothetical protein